LDRIEVIRRPGATLWGANAVNGGINIIRQFPTRGQSIPSVHAGVEKHFVIFPLDVWVAPAQREELRERLQGTWLTIAEALVHPQIAPSAKAVFFRVTTQEQHLDERNRVHAADEHRDEKPFLR
jgi:hypothetical protein